jgi:biopolymer transport protein ExbB
MHSRLLGKIRSMLLTILLGTFVLGLIGSMTLLTPTTARGQEEEVKKEEAPKKTEARELGFGEKIGHFLTSVGPLFGLMFVLISIFMLALFIIQIIDLRLGEAVPPAFVEEFTELVNKRKFKEAYELCRNDSSYIGRILTAGMGRLQYGIEDAREAMLAMADAVRSSKDAWISYFGMMGTIGPLLGLVGTVWGMMGAFLALGTSEGPPNPSTLAKEISHALAVTLAGVFLAVPAILCFTFFKNRLSNIAVNTVNLADDLLTQMYHNSKKASGVSAAGAAAVAAAPAEAAVQRK